MVALPRVCSFDLSCFNGVWDDSPERKLKKIFGIIAALLFLGACAGTLPVPGGSEAVNEACFESMADMEARLALLSPGMAEEEVLARLCRKKDGLLRLDRRDIRIALLGGDNIPFSKKYPEEEQDLIHSLYGYRLNFKSIKRKHGFTSPIRIRTDESGFNYSVILIFREGALFEKPILSGGVVKGSSSGTLFDFITPGTIIEGAVP